MRTKKKDLPVCFLLDTAGLSRTFITKRTDLHCAIYFAMGGWLTYVALQTGESFSTCEIPPRICVQARTIPTDSWSEGDLSPDGSIEAIKMPFSHPDGVFPDRSLRLKPDRWVFKSL